VLSLKSRFQYWLYTCSKNCKSHRLLRDDPSPLFGALFKLCSANQFGKLCSKIFACGKVLIVTNPYRRIPFRSI